MNDVPPAINTRSLDNSPVSSESSTRILSEIPLFDIQTERPSYPNSSDASSDSCNHWMDNPTSPIYHPSEVDTPPSLEVEEVSVQTRIHRVCTVHTLSQKHQDCNGNLERVFRGDILSTFTFVYTLILFLNEDIPATNDTRVLMNHISIRGVMVLQHLQELEIRRLVHETTIDLDTRSETVHDMTCVLGVLFMYLQFYRITLVLGWTWLRSSLGCMMLSDKYIFIVDVTLIPILILSMLLFV